VYSKRERDAKNDKNEELELFYSWGIWYSSEEQSALQQHHLEELKYPLY